MIFHLIFISSHTPSWQFYLGRRANESKGQVQRSHSIPLIPRFYVLMLIYFRATFTEIWNLFEYIYLVLVFITLWYLFYFVKFVCREMLASRLWKSLLFSTHSSWAISWVFWICCDVIWKSFLFAFIDFITGACSEIPCFIVSLFCGNQLFESYCNSTDWLPHDAGSRCGKSRNR